MNNMTFSPEIKFCVRYLVEHGIDTQRFEEAQLHLSWNDEDFELVKISKDDSFFDELAERLREMWPPGDKDGKWPWRDSVGNLSRRLQHLWDIRKLKQYSIEECIAAANKYLSLFENDTKYMQILKYFILKQDPIATENNRVVYSNKSRFADILESKDDFEKVDDEWNDILNGSTMEQGELI